MFMARSIGASRGPTDDFWYMDVNRGGAAGAGVTATSAMQLSTVYKCVRAIAETIGMLPVPVYRRLERGKERAPEHPLATLLQNEPNPWQTGMQWRELMQGHAALLGNGYSEIVYSGAGRVDMLVPLHPQRTAVEVLPTGTPRYRTRDEAGRERVLVAGQVLHLSGFTSDGYCGMNPIEWEREAIGAGLSSRDYGARYFKNGARPQTWIKMPAGVKFKDDEARQSFVNQFHAAYGGTNNGRTPVMDQGMELMSLSVSNSDSQWLESRKYSDVDICGLWRVPPHKIGILDRATWGNIEHQALEWVTDCIMPWARRWEQMLQRDLDFGPEYFPEFLLDALLRGDTATRFAAYGKGIQDGWMTRNEVRERENLNPLAGLDEPLEPLNMAPAGSRAADQERGNDTSTATPPRDTRAAVIMAAAAERVARKELALIKRCATDPNALADTFAGHERFVADVMAVPAAAARFHVEQTLARAADWLGAIADSTTGQAVIETQIAALLRLED